MNKGGTQKNLKPFKKGTTGNPNGRPRKLPELDGMLAEVLGDEKDGITAAKAILMALRKKATSGDVRAAEVLLDRAYGKPVSKIESKNTNTNANINIEKLSDDELMKYHDLTSKITGQ